MIRVIYINAIPRSGTTLLMTLISKYSNVAFVDTYPYETRLASYVAALAHVVLNPRYDINAWEFENDIQKGLIGAYPFQGDITAKEYFYQYFSTEIRAALARSLTNFARAIVRGKGYYGSEVSWLEKFPGTHQAEVEHIFLNFNTITLVRDPIDIARSVLSLESSNTSFWEKRENVSTLDELYRAEAKRVSDLYLAYQGLNAKNPSGHELVRYEDLVGDSENVTHRLADSFGWVAAASPSDSNQQVFLERQMDHHRAPPSADLRRSEIELAYKNLPADVRKSMQTLGYEPR